MKKQKIRRRKKSINQEESLYSSQNFASLRKQTLSLRHIKQGYSTIPINRENNLHQNKNQIIHNLTQNFRSKLKMDLVVGDAIQRQNVKKYNRLKKIQAEIMTLNSQKEKKIQQLTKIQKTTLKKIQEDMIRQKEIEQKMWYNYEIIMKEEGKINLTREVKKIRDKEDWILLDKERKRVELMNRSLEKKQFQLGRDLSLEPKIRRKLGLNSNEQAKKKNDGPQKKQRKKKNADQLKEIGRQFLQYAKKAQAEKLKQNSKKLDVYKKSIDYLPQIKIILRNHGKDLSKPAQPQQISSPRLRRRRSNPTKLNL